MRKLLTSGAVAVGMLLASCTPANRVVENPLIGAANTMTLDFPKIELSDTATVLHVDAYFRPHNCIRIDAGTYLLADGQKSAASDVYKRQVRYGHGLCFVRPGIRDVLDCPR